MLSKKNHIINYFKEVKYISDQIGISKIEKLVKELVKIRKKKGDVVIVIPTVNQKMVTAHSEAFQAVIWHCLVSHPLLQIKKMKW